MNISKEETKKLKFLFFVKRPPVFGDHIERSHLIYENRVKVFDKYDGEYEYPSTGVGEATKNGLNAGVWHYVPWKDALEWLHSQQISYSIDLADSAQLPENSYRRKTNENLRRIFQ